MGGAMRVLSSETNLALSSFRNPSSSLAHPRASPPAGGASGEPSGFSRLLGRFGRELDRGEKTLSAAARGGAASDPGALLALQAGVYRYVEAVDLASKLVDHATSAVKTTLQSQ